MAFTLGADAKEPVTRTSKAVGAHGPARRGADPTDTGQTPGARSCRPARCPPRLGSVNTTQPAPEASRSGSSESEVTPPMRSMSAIVPPIAVVLAAEDNLTPVMESQGDGWPPLYDIVTAALCITALVLLVTSVVLLFRSKLSPTASLLWFVAAVAFPVLGPIALFLYLSKTRDERQR